MTVRRWVIFTVVVGQLTGATLAGAALRPSSPTPSTVLVQLGLRVLGYDPGPIDGLSGRRTVAALAAYARDRRIVLNQATAALVVTLLAAEASEALHYGESAEELLPARGPRMLPVHQW